MLCLRHVFVCTLNDYAFVVRLVLVLLLLLFFLYVRNVFNLT